VAENRTYDIPEKPHKNRPVIDFLAAKVAIQLTVGQKFDMGQEPCGFHRNSSIITNCN